MKRSKFFQRGDCVWVKHCGMQRYGYVESVDGERAVITLPEYFSSPREVVSRHFSHMHLASEGFDFSGKA